MHEILQFVTRHGYAVLFAAVLAEQCGIPVPSVPVLLAVGTLIGVGALHLAPALAVAVLASLIGDTLWFALGAWRGRSILRLLCRVSLEPDSCVRNTEGLYTRYGASSLLFAKFVPGLSTVAPPLAGVVGLGRWKFVLFDGLGSLVWSGAYILVGWVFRAQIEQLAEILAGMGSSLALLLGALLAAWLLIKYAQRRRIYRTLRTARISPEALHEAMATEAAPIVMDLRHPPEWAEGGIPGARRVRATELDGLAAEFPASREIVLYCS